MLECMVTVLAMKLGLMLMGWGEQTGLFLCSDMENLGWAGLAGVGYG